GCVCVFFAAAVAGAAGPVQSDADLNRGFTETVRPFINTYCIKCHGGEKPKAELSFQQYSNLAAVVKEYPNWARSRERLISKEMPPEDAAQPSSEERQRVIEWVEAVRKSESSKH